MYAVGLIAIAGVQVVQRAFYAFSDNATPLIVGAVTALVHILLNVLFMRLWGVSGIALSTSLTAGITVIALVWLFQRRASHLSLSGLGSYAGRCLALALLCTAPFIWIYASLSFPEGALNYLVGVALSGLAGLTYLLLAWATRIPEGALLWHAGGRFLKRTRE